MRRHERLFLQLCLIFTIALTALQSSCAPFPDRFVPLVLSAVPNRFNLHDKKQLISTFPTYIELVVVCTRETCILVHCWFAFCCQS